MLPVLLTADLCSLRAHVDRLAFSAFIDVDEDGTVLQDALRADGRPESGRADLRAGAAHDRCPG